MPSSMPGAAMLRQAFQRLSITTSASTTSSLSAAARSSSTSSSSSSSSSSTVLRSARTFSTRPAMASSSLIRPTIMARTTTILPAAVGVASTRAFSVTSVARGGTWLEPNLNRQKRMMKGRPRVATGGSAKGTTVVWGDYGLRMLDHHRRITAKQLKVAEDTIKARLRGQRYRLYKRVNCNVGVFVSGNEIRMGKGKGSFDHWASRVAVSRIIFEIRGAIHEQVVRDAFRLAGNKLPGQYEFVKKGDPAVVGITKLEGGLTVEDLKRPWKSALLAPQPPAVAPVVVEEVSSSAPAASAPPA